MAALFSAREQLFDFLSRFALIAARCKIQLSVSIVYPDHINMVHKLTFAVLFALNLTMFTFGQIPYNEEHFRVFDSKGNPSTLDAVIASAAETDAIFLGELHDDAVGHAIQFEIFRRVVDKHSADRRIALSLEMFERDVQIVIDEYLANLIREDHFLSSSRPWGNYKTDYKPLVELAK